VAAATVVVAAAAATVAAAVGTAAAAAAIAAELCPESDALASENRVERRPSAGVSVFETR